MQTTIPAATSVGVSSIMADSSKRQRHHVDGESPNELPSDNKALKLFFSNLIDTVERDWDRERISNADHEEQHEASKRNTDVESESDREARKPPGRERSSTLSDVFSPITSTIEEQSKRLLSHVGTELSRWTSSSTMWGAVSTSATVPNKTNTCPEPLSMTPLTIEGLPKRVLHHIVAELTPDEMMNTALSCKKLHNFCNDTGELERHLDRQRSYSVLNFGPHGNDPLDVLIKIKEDWRIASYVKVVHLQPPGTQPLLAQKLDNTNGASFALLPPLLLLLPNLHRIRLTNFSGHLHIFEDLINQVERLSSGEALPKLQVIEFHSSEVPAKSVLSFKDAVSPLAALPWVSTVRAVNISWKQAFDTSFDTHLTAVEMTNCRVAENDLRYLLWGCQSLRTFSYNWNRAEPTEALPGRSVLWDLIMNSHRYSLENLRVTGPTPPLTPNATDSSIFRDGPALKQCPVLKQCTDLKHAHLSLDLFVDGDVGDKDRDVYDQYRTIYPLHKFLPQSIEAVTIDVRKPQWLHRAEWMMNGLILKRNARDCVQFLESITFESEAFTTEDVDRLTKRWERKMEKIGIKIVFRRMGS